MNGLAYAEILIGSSQNFEGKLLRFDGTYLNVIFLYF